MLSQSSMYNTEAGVPAEVAFECNQKHPASMIVTCNAFGVDSHEPTGGGSTSRDKVITNQKKVTAKAKPRNKATATHYNGVALPSGTDATSRYQRRRIRNKLSAEVHRQRKRDTLERVKQEVEDCDLAINELWLKLYDVSH